MQVKKQDIKVGKAIFEGDIKSGAEGSIIVPDVKPDILKILQADAETFLTEKSIDSGKLVLKGKLYVNVLYVPESENDSIQCIKGCFEFCETVKNPDFDAGMQVVAYADAQKVGYKLINSRKVGIDAQISICVQVTGMEKCNVICDIADDCAEIKKSSVCISSGENYREYTFHLDESCDLPETKPKMREILKSNVAIFDKECRTLSGKLVVKGRARISILYMSEECMCEHIDFELPFTEVFEMEELFEGCECDITFIPEETDAVISQGLSGDKNSISITADVRVCVRTEMCEEIEVVTDCYFTNCCSELKYQDILSEQIVGKPAMSCVLKEMLEKGEGQPEISGIYTAVAKPVITSTQIQNGKIAVSGKVTVYVLYTSDSMQNPVCSINEELPFSYMVDCENVSRGDDVLLFAECEHISCTINSAETVEMRCGLCIKGRVVKKCSIKAVCDAEISGALEKDSAMVIYFAKNGDSLWEIGKNYHVKCQKIQEANKLDENMNISQGEKLIIPVN